MSKSCAQEVTKARFIFVELCNGDCKPTFFNRQSILRKTRFDGFILYKNSHNEVLLDI